MENNKFQFWLPLAKSEDGPDGERILSGIASTEDVDLDNEKVRTKGLDTSHLMNQGFIKWEHGTGPGNYIGEPIEARILPNGGGLAIKARLFQGPSAKTAEDAWQLAKALEENKAKRRLGWSIEGFVTHRKGNEIVKAKLLNIALTPQPKNAATWASIQKSFSADAELEFSDSFVGAHLDSVPSAVAPPAPASAAPVQQLVKSIEQRPDGTTLTEFHPIGLIPVNKALEAGYGTDAATMTGGRALVAESLDSDDKAKKEKKKKGNGGDDTLKQETPMGKSLSFEDAAGIIRKRFPMASDADCQRIIQLSEKQ